MELPYIFSHEEFLTDPRRRVLDVSAAETLARACQTAQRDAIWVEGFPLAGKSHLADVIGSYLGWRVVHLDELCFDDQRDRGSYAASIDPLKLSVALGAPEQHRRVVIEGICLRDVTEAFAARRSAFVVYLMRVSEHADRMRWDDGNEAEQGTLPADWADRCAYEYHRRTHPQREADLTFARIE